MANSKNSNDKHEPLTRSEVKKLTMKRLDTIFKSSKRRLVELNKRFESVQSRLDKRRKTGTGGSLKKLVRESDKTAAQIRICRQDLQMVDDERKVRQMRNEPQKSDYAKKREARYAQARTAAQNV